MSKETIRRVLETLKIVLGISSAIAAIWLFKLPFDPEKVVQVIDIILGLLPVVVGITLAVNGGRQIVQLKRESR